MNEQTTVGVFLGKPVDVLSERQFLARLQRDLQALGVSARVLANLQIGRNGDRQVDFVVITEQRTTVVELKTFPGPILNGPRNGSWTVRVGGGTVENRRNPLTQARSASQFLSDELHDFAAGIDVPGPTGPKFWSDLDAVACAFPVLPAGSKWESLKHVELVAYDALLARLQEPGPSVRWSRMDWDRFVRHLNLYRAEEDAPESVIRRAGAAAVDSYVGLFREAHGTDDPQAETTVVVHGTRMNRPDVTRAVAAGEIVLLRGVSGTGKTLWARSIAVELATAGHLPIWIEADMCEGSFLTTCARAVAPYSTLNVNELLKAADADGRTVVFVVDDLSKVPADGLRRLVDGLRTARVRASGRGLLITDQHTDPASGFGQPTAIEMPLPNDDDRVAVLTAYGHGELVERCEAFLTPLELSMAAGCADDLGPELSHADLFDIYVDKLVGGDPVTRGALRSIAAFMVSELRPFLLRGEVARLLRRAHGTSDEQLRKVFDCRLLVAARGRLSFSHEQFERFLAAEAMIVDEVDPVALGDRLNTPSVVGLGADVIGLERDRGRLETLLSLCDKPDLLVAAANGSLGSLAAEVVRVVFADAISTARLRTTEPGIQLRVGADALSGCEWETPNPLGQAQTAQLSAVGRLLAEGTWIDGVDALLRDTDELCVRAAKEADLERADDLLEHAFAASYALAFSGGLPVTPLAEAATNHFRLERDPDRVEVVIGRLLPDGLEPDRGALWIAAHLLRLSDLPLRLDVVKRCVRDSAYHLRLIGLQLAQDRTWCLTDEERQMVIEEIEALPSNNIFLNTAQLEALSALDGVQPARTEADIAAEIKETLSMKGEPLGIKRAYGIISSQFESEFVGPYYEVVSTLPPKERLQLLAMALDGCNYDWLVDGFILGEIEDLTVPEIREAVRGYVTRFSPDRTMNYQWAMQALIRAITLLARSDEPVPRSAAGERDPAWQAALELIRAAAGDDEKLLDREWEVFVTEHPDAVASFVGKLKGVRRTGEESWVLKHLEEAMPTSASNALVVALEHPDRIHSIGGTDYLDLRADLVEKLADVGDLRAAEVLRRYADDPAIGRSATEAVRAIEMRLSS